MARGQGKVGQAKSKVIAELPRACSDETAAVEFLEALRWNGEPFCPRCGDTAVRQIKSRKGQRAPRFLWLCKRCKRQFTVRIGTVFEDSRIPLMHWCYAFWAACASKKGVSAKQIQRQTGVSYKSALFLMHRIRYAMAEDAPKAPPLTGIVEVDETFIGGKPRYRGPHNKRGPATKQPVMALVERRDYKKPGRVRARVVPNVTADTLQGEVRRLVDRKARIITDESASYIGLARDFEGGHDSIPHKYQIYSWMDITTNTVESFFATLKRGLYGTYHAVSRKHLHRYISQFEFLYNTRRMEDGERMLEAIKGAEGKRLMYTTPVKS